jgi:DnaA family protein
VIDVTSGTDFRQLPLEFAPRDVFTFDNFIAADNAIAVELARQMALGAGEPQMLLWAGSGSGKSHLLQAACNLAAARHSTVCYLPAAQFVDYDGGIFDALEQVQLICIDDVHLLLRSMQWEEALFDLINRVREAGSALMLASAIAPEAMDIHLPDLRSRLTWGPVFRLQEMDDAAKLGALRQRAHQRGLELGEPVAEYLLRRYPRDLFSLLEKLDQLDMASMALQRRLTIPFVKSVLGA